MFRGILANHNNADFALQIELLNDYCTRKFIEYGHKDTAKRRVDSILQGIPLLFTPTPNVKVFNTRHYCLIAMFLWETLQEHYDVGQYDEDVYRVVAGIFEFFNEHQEDWNEEKFIRSLDRRTAKVIEFLQSKELFVS
jgi:hypothetical protein